jgi:prepilin-type N-terminal cleavage/methylation domain-containing protein
MSIRSVLAPERGMTIIELMVSVTVLAVGILGTVAMIDTSNANTSRTKAREGATSLGRALMEISRGTPYRDLDEAQLLATINGRPGFADASPAAGHQISSRNFLYSVDVDICLVDDGKDGFGEREAESDPPYCTDNVAPPLGDPLRDRNPDDYKRVSLAFGWRSEGVTASSRQTGVISNPVGGLGPSIADLEITAPTPGITTISTPAETASFRATTSVAATEVSWSIEGQHKGKAAGGPLTWTFHWDLTQTKPDGTLLYPDCTYLIGAEAIDDKDRSGAPKALTISLNRIRPVAPTGLEGGRNLNGNRVDLQWSKNRECDITGYRVYRGTSPGSTPDLACSTPPNIQECVDEAAPAPAAGQTLYYRVLATDTRPDLTPGLGDFGPAIAIPEGNVAPSAVTNLSVCAGGTPGCNDIDGNAVPSGSNSLRWDPATDADGSIYFYRIYRNGNTYSKRYSVLFPVSGKPLVFVDSAPVAGSNSYYVSAVDDRFGESPLLGPVTVSP